MIDRIYKEVRKPHMGYYINPTDMTKEEWIAKHGTLITTFFEWTHDTMPVCLVDNGPFKVLAIAYSPAELKEFLRPDSREKIWYLVPLEHLLPYLPKEFQPFTATGRAKNKIYEVDFRISREEFESEVRFKVEEHIKSAIVQQVERKLEEAFARGHIGEPSIRSQILHDQDNLVSIRARVEVRDITSIKDENHSVQLVHQIFPP